MSIHSSVNMANFIRFDETPEWMRTERYEYCESFDQLKAQTGLLEKLISLFI